MHRVLLAAAAMAAVALALVGASPAARARTSDTFHFSDPFSRDFSCGTFTVTLTGHDRRPGHAALA